ncbi:hypothetical protein B0I37DRAFT_380479 [Chaetomium sp. MPI-CAGE-AT-0009]|nr:hypothetical protein B0I37DRAFT_380479 [Chaetomium sp. MPI-CAGE-AT-0009]
MEAIAAVALAGNVAQFIEYSIKAVLKTYELLRKPNEAWKEAKELKDVVSSAYQSLQSIRNSRDVNSTGCVPDKVLETLVASCLAVSSEIRNLLNSLELDDLDVGLLQNVERKARSLVMRPELKALCSRLHTLRDQISAHLLFLIREQQQDLAWNFRRFASSSEEFQQVMETKLGEVTDYLRLISEQTRPLKTPAQSSELGGLMPMERNMPETANPQPVLGDPNPAEARLLQEPELLKPEMLGWVNGYTSEMLKLLEQKQWAILDTLHFSQIKEREFSIAEAHRETFQWIFGEKGRNKFVRWLRQNDGIYWVAGKAGSGKSTLMKFLTDHPNTRQLLNEWAGEKKLIMAKHYFWSSGTAIQKSQEGLFRSLLLQILNQNPEIIPDVCPDRWEAPFADAFSPWSRTQLITAFDKLGSLKTSGYRICLFIDGLDEYYGDHAELVSVIRRMGASDNIKICVSSRQWLEFSDEFEKSGRALYLQDLTHDDIRRYIHDELNKDSRFKRLQKRNKAEAQKLEKEITERAHGVFLWVFLVVRSLLRGLRNEDEISDLQRRLRELPNDLREYFDRMLVTIEDVYKERTARLFLTMSQAKTTFPLMAFYFMDLGDGSASPEFLNYWLVTHPDEAKALETKKRQLIAQCKDLIFITADPGTGELFSQRVGFLHRTVGDYLQTTDVKPKLLQMAGADFNADKVLLKTNLGQLRSLIHLHHRTHIQPHVQQWILGSLYYAHALEVMSGDPATDALDELELIIMKVCGRWDFSTAMDCFFERPDTKSFLELVCQCDLASYVCKKHPQLTPRRLDALAPGWRRPFGISQNSGFEIYERWETTKNVDSDWRLGRRLGVWAVSSSQQNPAAEEGPPEEDTESARVHVRGTTPVKGRISSKFGRKFWRRLFGSHGQPRDI